MFRLKQHSGGAFAAGGLLAQQQRWITLDGVMVQRGRCVDPAPRAEQDFTLPRPKQDGNGAQQQQKVIPGTHPLPLTNEFVKAATWPLISPFMPSPHRSHPYWTAAPEELICFDPSIPNVFGPGVTSTPIVVPVFDTTSSGEGGAGKITHARKLSNFIFGTFPQVNMINFTHMYWICRNHNMADQWDFHLKEINRRAKKNWANTGTGMGRVSQRKEGVYPWGAPGRANKPWRKKMAHMDPVTWQTANRHMLTLKLLQGKLQVVKDLDLPEPTPEAFKDLCDRMKWDVRHDGAGVLFMDGGSRIAPSIEFNNNFFYGSFHNGRNKLVRPTILCDESINTLRTRGSHPDYLGPNGSKNPIPINRFNTYDALDHHLLVITEGALHQIEQEIFPVMYEQLPPHIRQQLPDLMDTETTQQLYQGSHLLGDSPVPLGTLESEVAGRIEESERDMYKPFYDNPYKPWADEGEAAYYVNAVDGYVTRHVPASTSSSEKTPTEAASDSQDSTQEQAWEDGSWRVLE